MNIFSILKFLIYSMSSNNLNIPNNCVAIGPEAYCVLDEKPNIVSSKYRLSQLAYNLWEKDPNPITKDDNKLITNPAYSNPFKK